MSCNNGGYQWSFLPTAGFCMRASGGQNCLNPFSTRARKDISWCYRVGALCFHPVIPFDLS